MDPIDPATLYADSPDRMLGLSILFLVAVVLLVLSNHRWGNKRRTYQTAPSPELPSVSKPDQYPRPAWLKPEEQHGPG